MLMPTVFIPGFPASGLHDANAQIDLFPPTIDTFLNHKEEFLMRLQGPDDPDAEDGITTNGVITKVKLLPWFTLSQEASTLYAILKQFGYQTGDNFVPIAWDWRRPVYCVTVLNRVAEAINALYAKYSSRIAVIAHSTGGLVIRALLEKHSDKLALADKIGTVVSLSVPWAGTLKSLRMVAKGEKMGIGPVGISAAEVRKLIGRAWAAYDLMPPDPLKTDMTNSAGAPLDLCIDKKGKQVSPLVKTAWIGTDSAMLLRSKASDTNLGIRSKLPDFSNRPIQIVNVAGWGAKTDTTAELDGTSVNLSKTLEGDGTVPVASAAWISGSSIRTFRIPVGLSEGLLPEHHSQIWDTDTVKNLLRETLLGMSLTPVFAACFDNNDVVNKSSTVRLRVAAYGPDGNPLPDSRLRIKEFGKPVPLTKGTATISFPRGPKPSTGWVRLNLVFDWNVNGQVYKQHMVRAFYH